MNPNSQNNDIIPGMLSDVDIKHFWNKGILFSLQRVVNLRLTYKNSCNLVLLICVFGMIASVLVSQMMKS